jgi:Trk K+ transport system NAD-binding subunit
MRSLPLIIVVGANDLALRVCEELCATSGHDVLVMWNAGEETAERVCAMGAAFANLPPNNYDSLEAVNVRQAACIMPVCEDDRLNLQIALKARDLNPEIRIVLRQFNRALGRKIEQNLPDCSAISPAAHAAATFAAAALDPACLYAVQFPAADGPLLAFSERRAADFGLNDCSVSDAERRMNARITAVNGRVDPEPGDTIRREDLVVACAPVEALQAAWSRRGERRRSEHRLRARTSLRDVLNAAVRFEPLLFYTLIAGAISFFAASVFFKYDLRLSFVEAMYFTATSMLTVGYGDITPYNRHAGIPALVIAMAVMLVGVLILGVFIATISSALSRAQETALRGLRHIHAEDHVVVCGAGNVGTRVIDLLLRLKQRVLVVERSPSALLLEQARTKQIDLLAADTTNDETLEFCSLPSAQSLVAITDSDTANLEAALGALDRNPELAVVMRIMDPAFSRSVESNFKIAKSFSASDLTAAAIAGLARFPGSRGRVTFAGETFNVGERSAATRLPRAEGTIPLYAWRAGSLVPLHDFAHMQPEDRLLYVVPLSQFRAG